MSDKNNKPEPKPIPKPPKYPKPEPRPSPEARPELERLFEFPKRPIEKPKK